MGAVLACARGMTNVPKLKAISATAVKAALEKAEHYRLLNEPDEAESICLDVLELEPQNQRALKNLILSLTDQFAVSAGSVRRARERIGQLDEEYERVYYAALICERHGRAQLSKGMSAGFAYDSFREAIDGYEAAEALRPEGNDDPILRRNSCIRTIEREGLRPIADNPEPELDD